jgi:hypothetical protein
VAEAREVEISLPVPVQLELPVVSNVPGRVGNWTLHRVVRYPAVPREGDWVELDSDGEILERVVRVDWRRSGQPVVRLSRLETAERGVLDPYDALLGDGWQRHGEAWKDQPDA